MDLRIHVTDAAIGLRRASKTEEMWTKNTPRYLVLITVLYFIKYSVVELYYRKKHRERFFEKYSHARVLLIDGGAVKKILATVRERTNPTTWNHIFKLQRQNRGA